MAFISIIVPVYNAERTLRSCLNSIVNQSYLDWVCFLVNDGSTDDSQTIIDEYTCLSGGGKFFSLLKKNEGTPAKARQFAMSSITTPFVVAIDADDCIGVDFLEKMVKRQTETGADVIVPVLRCFSESTSNVLWELPDLSFDKNQIFGGKEACLLTIPEWVIGFNGSLIRRELMLSTSSGDWMSSDELKTREILINSNQVAFSEAIYYYRSNPQSITRTISPRLFEKSIVEGQLVKFAEKNYPENLVLIEKLRRKHFSGLQYNIVLFDEEKNTFSKDECKTVEKVLAESYRLIKIRPLIRSSFKWGLVVALMTFKSYQRLVVCHFNRLSN